MKKTIVGKVLNETYLVERELAEGGMGEVYFATHARLPNKRYAIKVLNTAAPDEKLRRRFRREAEIITQLQHPNIVDVIDLNEMPGGRPYIVMEYLEGVTLATRLAEGGRLSTSELTEILEQVAKGLHAGHEIGVIHRDIKPANIFLLAASDQRVRCKVLDFGVSKLLDVEDSLTQANMLLGTFEFMSPEQAVGGSDEVDVASDVFSLGTLAYYLLSGRLPFKGSNPPRVLASIRHIDPDFELLPIKARPVVSRALAKEKVDRYQDVLSFAAELREALEDEMRQAAASEAEGSHKETSDRRRTLGYGEKAAPPVPEEGAPTEHPADEATKAETPRARALSPVDEGAGDTVVDSHAPSFIAPVDHQERGREPLESSIERRSYGRRPLVLIGGLVALALLGALLLTSTESTAPPVKDGQRVTVAPADLAPRPVAPDAQVVSDAPQRVAQPAPRVKVKKRSKRPRRRPRRPARKRKRRKRPASVTSDIQNPFE